MDDAFDSDQFQHRVYRETTRKHAYDGQTGAAFADWQDAAREDLQTVLGHHVIRERRADGERPDRSETVRTDAYERQLWYLRSERGVTVPFFLFVPTDSEPPHPVVFTIHGHNDTGKELLAGTAHTDAQREAIHQQRRDTAIQAVRRGYAAIAPDMRGFGALAASNPDPDGDRACTHMQKTAQLYGRSLLGDRVWDVLQLVDFVERRSVLDADRIGITGHSGGGAVALFAGALDQRFRVVAPNAYFCALEESILPIDHCACNYVPGLLRIGELWDIAGLVAPRPLAVATGEHDQIVPVSGTHRAFENIRAIYTALDVPDRCELYVGGGGHRFYPEGVWPFVRAHL